MQQKNRIDHRVLPAWLWISNNLYTVIFSRVCAAIVWVQYFYILCLYQLYIFVNTEGVGEHNYKLIFTIILEHICRGMVMKTQPMLPFAFGLQLYRIFSFPYWWLESATKSGVLWWFKLWQWWGPASCPVSAVISWGGCGRCLWGCLRRWVTLPLSLKFCRGFSLLNSPMG